MGGGRFQKTLSRSRISVRERKEYLCMKRFNKQSWTPPKKGKNRVKKRGTSKEGW